MVDVDTWDYNNPEGSTAMVMCDVVMPAAGMGTAAVHETTTLFQWRHDFFPYENFE